MKLLFIVLISVFAALAPSSAFAAYACDYEDGHYYTLCKAIVEKNCELADGDDSDICRGVVNNDPAIAGDGADKSYFMAKGIAERNCDEVDGSGDDYDFCKRMGGRLDEN